MKQKSYLKITSLALALVAALSFSMSVAASDYLHPSDDWKKGAWPGITATTQYSEFYCGETTHRATVAWRYNDELTIHYQRVDAAKKKWAKSSKRLICPSELNVRRSYYSHI